MKVLFDYAAFVMQPRGGVSRVLYELFRHVAEFPEIEFKLFAGFHRNQYLRDAPEFVKRHIVGWHLPTWMVKQRIFMPINRWLFKYYASRFRPDICHFTYFDTPKVPAGCKVVITMHDMIHELFPEMFGTEDPQHGWKVQAVSRADGIICVSENTRKDLERFIDIQGKKVTVIHHGNSMVSVEPSCVEYPYEYFLYVGTRAVEYKNSDLILLALSLSLCKKKTTAHLICFGGGQFTPAEKDRINELGLSGKVHQVGGSDEVLAGHYASALALIYPSKYEGFGLPPIEAMGAGCPVLSSEAPPMPEIVGDAGLFFNPENVRSLCRQMELISNPENRKRLVDAGKKHADYYSWGRAAESAVRFYESLR